MCFSSILTSTSLLTIRDFFFCGGVVCFTAVPFMDQDPIMQNVVYAGRTSKYYPIMQQRQEKPEQGEGGLQENNSTDQEDEQTLLCTHSQFSPELLKRGLRRGLQLHTGAAGMRGLRAQSFTMLIWELSILKMKDGRTSQQTAIVFPRSEPIT